jgi:hypothetical protein
MVLMERSSRRKHTQPMSTIMARDPLNAPHALQNPNYV